MSATPNPIKPAVVIPGTTRRDILLGVAAAVAVLGFVIFGIVSMSHQVGGSTLRGEIIEKVFKPQEETQIIVGRNGAQRRDVKGEYILKVRVPGEENRVFKVWVDEQMYRRHQVGESFSFQRPAPRLQP